MSSNVYRVQIDLERAAELGRRLIAAREARGWGPFEVAHRLLLSQQQVLGLESADDASFYNRLLFARCAAKYAELVELDAGDLLEQLLHRPPADQATRAKADPLVPTHAPAARRLWLLGPALLLGAGLLVLWANHGRL